VWTYPDPAGARRLEKCLSDGTLGDLAIADGVVATWTRGRGAAQVRELQGVARTFSLGTTFWGMLFGIVVAGPSLVRSVGSPPHALDSSLEAIGVDREFLVSLRVRMRPGGSAVAAVCTESAASAIASVSNIPEFASSQTPTDAATSTVRRLTPDQEHALRRVFGV
jgi:uncharacterized membrane protein